MNRQTAFVTAIGVVAALGSTAGAQNREHQQMSAELRILQEQQQQVSLALAQVTEALKALNTRLDEAGLATRKGFANQELSIRAVGSDLSAIRERTQETDTRVRTLRDEIEALRATMASLPSLISQAATPPAPTEPVDPSAPTAPVSAVVPPPVVPPTSTPSTAGLSPTRMLDSAKSDYFAGQFSLAVSGFEALLRTFPRSESAADAQFYIGESYFAQTKWREAIDAYGLVLQNHRTSSTVPDAMFKRGRAYDQMGQIDAARAAWEMVIKAYPDSDAARLAKQHLDRINRKPADAK